MNEKYLLEKSLGQIALEKAYQSIFPNKCLFCRKVLGGLGEITCGDCTEAYAFCDYDEEVVRHVIFRFKYEGKRMLARPMAELMSRRLEDVSADCLVCVPLHQNRLKQRGFNQAALLATELSRLFGITAYDGMVRTRDTARQFDLGREERVANVAGAFALKDEFCVDGKKVLLVDDVLTTGTTTTECAKVLAAAGAKAVEVVAFAVSVL